MNSVKVAAAGGGVAFLSVGDIILALVISGVILIIFGLLYRSFYNKVEDKMVESAESLIKEIKAKADKKKPSSESQKTSKVSLGSDMGPPT